MSAEFAITKETLNEYLKELGKEFRRLNGTKMRAELILVGGASVIANYGFREVTYDIDAYIKSSSAMKQAIGKVGDNHNLPRDWLNTDFTETKSFTPNLSQYSEFYRTFSNILDVRTVKGKYLIAMKLMSGRAYKTDLSDIVGVLTEHDRINSPISRIEVEKALYELYGKEADLSETAKQLLDTAYTNPNLNFLYEIIKNDENQNKIALKNFEADYPGQITDKNINDVINQLRKKAGELKFNVR
jgi:hypothetical protein